VDNFKFYQLYINKKENIIKVSPAAKTFQIPDVIKKLKVCEDKEVMEYNSYHWFSRDRAALVAMGRKVKEEWLSKIREKLNKIESIKI
jgi:hypothetical protein